MSHSNSIPSGSTSQTDLEQATETTPLISNHDNTRYINPEVDRRLALDTSSLEEGLLRQQVWRSEDSLDRGYEVVVLLRMMARLHSRSASRDESVLSPDLDIQRKSDVVGAAVATHEQFMDWPHLTMSAMEGFLLERFFVDENSTSTIRVLDLLSSPYLPSSFRHHKVLEAALTHMWRHGSGSQQSKRSLDRALGRLQRLLPPRVMHVLDLVLFLIYFTALVDYTVRPPAAPLEPVQTLVPRLREVYIMVYAFARLCKPWEATAILYALTFLAFLSCLSSVPRPQDGAYSLLLLTVSLHVLQLHLPRAPGPLLLLPFDMVLPLATLVQDGIFKIFLPVIFFFLPALLLALFLLSTSLSDLLLYFTSTLAFGPSPLEARTAFLTLLAVVFVLLLCSLMMLVLVYPHLSYQNPPPDRWDRFSQPIGSGARRAMFLVVATYAQPTYFPPPLNLLSITFASIPAWIVGKLGRKRLHTRLKNVRKIIWLALVAPLAFLVSSIYLWGYV